MIKSALASPPMLGTPLPLAFAVLEARGMQTPKIIHQHSTAKGYVQCPQSRLDGPIRRLETTRQEPVATGGRDGKRRGLVRACIICIGGIWLGGTRRDRRTMNIAATPCPGGRLFETTPQVTTALDPRPASSAAASPSSAAPTPCLADSWGATGDSNAQLSMGDLPRPPAPYASAATVG
ncbi:hypothetical protein THAOC_31051 [Thalassiosira oceanica]|uniref:Uncharacterized protein n=1 Tax=Thalassiosira oceanica TaxID=159749 RepID=K0R8W9_THAOC|nr:hypothetical protein THAOC_31051 [Thalassiosira oceanica]|eukprot:EJK50013.1 hypothetical protein THAOC_31051 [Thalassiosira oceanica]